MKNFCFGESGGARTSAETSRLCCEYHNQNNQLKEHIQWDLSRRLFLRHDKQLWCRPIH